jgi:hypothetical protein
MVAFDANNTNPFILRNLDGSPYTSLDDPNTGIERLSLSRGKAIAVDVLDATTTALTPF